MLLWASSEIILFFFLLTYEYKNYANQCPNIFSPGCFLSNIVLSYSRPSIKYSSNCHTKYTNISLKIFHIDY